MGHARVTRHAHTVLTRGLDCLSYSCSIIAPRICSRCSCPHFCLHGEMSKRQVTLFGTVAKKGRFFSGSAAGITPYHQVVEKLFELDNGERSRQEFHRWVQEQWREVYRDDTKKREELLARRTAGAQGLLNPFKPLWQGHQFFSCVTADETPAKKSRPPPALDSPSLAGDCEA